MSWLRGRLRNAKLLAVVRFQMISLRKFCPPKIAVEQQPQVMAGGRVAVEVEAAGRLQDAVEFDEARGHHGEVGHHRAGVEEAVERLHQVEELGVAGSLNELLVGGGVLHARYR